MRIRRTYTFIVTGADMFPFDMLRYDTCHPRTERDSAEIERSSRAHGHGGQDFRVTLVGPKPPTEARWGSFGWAVESVE